MVCTSLIDRVIGFDQRLTLLLNDLNCAASEQFWLIFSNKHMWLVTYLVCTFFLFRRLGWKKACIVLLSVAMAFGACDQFSNLVKYSTCRLRPSYNYWMISNGVHILEGRGGLYGFFSAHAANAFAVAICLIIGFRNDITHSYNAFCIWSLTWATLVSVSRIFVGKHFFFDVVVGSIIGMVFGLFFALLAKYVIQKYIEKVKTLDLTSRLFGILPATAKE